MSSVKVGRCASVMDVLKQEKYGVPAVILLFTFIFVIAAYVYKGDELALAAAVFMAGLFLPMYAEACLRRLSRKPVRVYVFRSGRQIYKDLLSKAVVHIVSLISAWILYIVALFCLFNASPEFNLPMWIYGLLLAAMYRGLNDAYSRRQFGHWKRLFVLRRAQA